MSLSSPTRIDTPLLERARREARLGDLLALVAVPLVLIVVFFVPERVTDRLVLYYLEPTVFTAYTTHFVHYDPGHLLGNLIGYGLLAGVGYLLAITGDHRRFFMTSFLAIVVVFPLALSGLNVAVPRNAVGYGFSGLNMAFLGVLALVLNEFLRERFPPALERRDVVIAYFLTVAAIALLAVPLTTATITLATASFATAGVYAHRLAGRAGRLRAVCRGVLERPGDGELALAGVVIFVGYLFVAFPTEVVSGSTIVNLYAHFLGYALGFIGPYLALETGLFDERVVVGHPRPVERTELTPDA
ncbi:hypothetical protein ACLI4Y_07130 [Natrialbaceae archaeon A-CW3]